MRHILEELETLVRAGRHPEVKARLSELDAKRIPRKMLWQFAHIAGRIRQPWLSLRWLNPIVRHINPTIQPASPKELLEYAIALSQVGVHAEADQILANIEHPQMSRVYRAQAFCCIYRWDYNNAIPFLNRFIANEPDPYQQTVGQLNLAAAFLAVENHEASRELLLSLREKMKGTSHSILRGNIEEVLGQLYLLIGDYNASNEYLQAGKTLFGDSGSIYSFFIRKWEAILQLHRTGSSAKSMAALESVRSEAQQRKHYESLRECDLFEGICTQNSALVEKVYFGTPYPVYRDRILGLWKQGITGVDYIWGASKSNVDVLDLQRGSFAGTDVGLSGQNNLLNLLQILARDFYQPQTVGGLFSALYPGTYFDPLSSVNRVQRLISRARQRLEAIPVEIVCDKSAYFLRTHGCGIQVTIQARTYGGRYERELESWPSSLKNSEFRLAEAQAETGLSKSTVNRMLKWGIEIGRVQMYRSGTNVTYRFVGPKIKTDA